MSKLNNLCRLAFTDEDSSNILSCCPLHSEVVYNMITWYFPIHYMLRKLLTHMGTWQHRHLGILMQGVACALQASRVVRCLLQPLLCPVQHALSKLFMCYPTPTLTDMARLSCIQSHNNHTEVAAPLTYQLYHPDVVAGQTLCASKDITSSCSMQCLLTRSD